MVIFSLVRFMSYLKQLQKFLVFIVCFEIYILGSLFEIYLIFEKIVKRRQRGKHPGHTHKWTAKDLSNIITTSQFSYEEIDTVLMFY